MNLSSTFLLIFTPETWTPGQKFSAFIGPPFSAAHSFAGASRSAENRRRKIRVLVELAEYLRPGLEADQADLDRDGYTSSARSQRFAAVIDAVFQELYSTLDAVRQALFASYERVRGVQNKSTERLFKLAMEGKYGPDFPETIRQALATAYLAWFPELRRIRVKVSHGDIGTCHRDLVTDRVAYHHDGIIIEDVESKVREFTKNTFRLVDSVFEYLCSQLKPIEVQTPCGMYKGRFYERSVQYSPSLNFNSGACLSRQWFEEEPEFLCPMRGHCGAYASSIVSRPQ